MAIFLIIAVPVTLMAGAIIGGVSRSTTLWKRRWRWLLPTFAAHAVLLGIAATAGAGNPGPAVILTPVVFGGEVLGVVVMASEIDQIHRARCANAQH